MVKDIETHDDTIASISTPPGPGGIGIVRLSGADSLKITDQIFFPLNGQVPSQLKSRRVYFGNVVNPFGDGDVIDEALLIIMRAPRSYTREDVVEIHCHGGMVAVKTILQLVIDAGARLAQPGEFTKRAFLNGRIDLVQAEAVLDMIQSKTQAMLKVSAHQLKGEITRQLEIVREQLLQAYIQLEALINFPEDEIEEQSRLHIRAHLNQASQQLQKLLKNSDQGRILREGAKVVLCGRPNVGKSSLLNVLLKHSRAIVSDIAGTTRDSIEEAAQIRGLGIQLVDTAGLLEPRDLIEEAAVQRSHAHIKSADLILLVLSAGDPLSVEDQKLIQVLAGQHVLVVINKSDLTHQLSDDDVKHAVPDWPFVRVSVKANTNIDQLEMEIERQVLKSDSIDPAAIIITNARQIDSLKQSHRSIQDAEQAVGQQLSLELISEQIKSGISALDRVTGKDVDEDLLEQIFSHFCIGK